MSSERKSGRTGAQVAKVVFALLALLAIGGWWLWRRGVEKRVDAALAEIRAGGLPTSGPEMNGWLPAIPAKEDGTWRMLVALDRFAAIPDGLRGVEAAGLLKTNAWTEGMRGVANRYLETNQTALEKL